MFSAMQIKEVEKVTVQNEMQGQEKTEVKTCKKATTVRNKKSSE